MPGSNSAVNNLIYGLNIAATAQSEAALANQRAFDAEQRARDAELEAAKKTTNKDLEYKLRDAQSRARIAESQASDLARQVAEKDAMLLEWMHSNEAFKKLAKSYGTKLGFDAEQRQKNVDNMISDVAQEDPKFANTKIGREAKAALSK